MQWLEIRKGKLNIDLSSITENNENLEIFYFCYLVPSAIKC